MSSLTKNSIVIFVIIQMAFSNQLLAQEIVSKRIQDSISVALKKIELWDTSTAIIKFKNILKLDSIGMYKCKIYLSIAELQFEQNKMGHNYRQTLDEALKCGCNQELILNEYELFFDELSKNNIEQYIDSSINLYSKLIILNPTKGRYYTKRSFARLLKGDTIGSESDLQMAVKYKDKLAIWYLEDQERKKKIRK